MSVAGPAAGALLADGIRLTAIVDGISETQERVTADARTPKQERSQARRAVILDAAARVFDRVGFGSASLSVIAADANVGQGGMYFYFRTKEALALAVIDEQNARTFKAMTPPEDATSPFEVLIGASRGIADLLLTDPVVRAGIRLSLEQGVFAEPTSDYYESWIQGVADGFEAARAAGELRDEFTPASLAPNVVSFFTGVQLVSNVRTQRADLFESLVTMWTVLINATVTDVSRDRLLAVVADVFRAS